MSKKTKAPTKQRGAKVYPAVDFSKIDAATVTGQAVEQLGGQLEETADSQAADQLEQSHDDAPQLDDVGPEFNAAQGSAVAAAFEPLPGEAPPAGFAPKILDDAPPADASGAPADRCTKCGDHETEGEPKTIRETHSPGVDPRTGRRFEAIAWRVVVCASCRQRRVRKVLIDAAVDAAAPRGAR